MKAVCHDNRERTFKPLSTTGAWGFKAILLTHDDLRPEHRTWLEEQVYPRLLPPVESVENG